MLSMKRSSFSLLLFLATSCTVVDSIDVDRGKDVFYAVIESDTSTRVFVDDPLRVLWDAGDMISIFNRSTQNQPYRFNGSTGDNSGSFSPVDAGTRISPSSIDRIVAVYPYQESTIIDDEGVSSVLLPDVQTYRKGSFGLSANAMVSTTADDDSTLVFKNLGGFLVFKFYGDSVSVSSIKIEGNNGEFLSGVATLKPEVGSVPTVTMSSGAGKSVTLSCDTPVELGNSKEDATAFWLVVPPTLFSKGLTVTLTDPDGNFFTKATTKSLTLIRNNMLRFSPIEVVMHKPATDVVEFYDRVFKAYCVQKFDSDGDGEISYSEAEKVTQIDVSSKDIVSLEGIQYFTRLKTLKCNSNRLINLDVSQNTALTTLNCHSNKLTRLDVSKNKSLSVLNCYNNQLTSLDLRNNTALKELNCRANKLSSLDLTNNKSLVTVYCNSNALISLNVSNCASLKNLYCNNNKLTSLDVSPNKALVEFWCYSNQLTSLTVGPNSTLKRLDCYDNRLGELDLSNSTALQVLYCYSNQLTSLILTNDASIEELSCNENRLTSLDISGCPKLGWLYCCSNRLTSLDVDNNTNLKVLHCYSNQLASLDVSKCTIMQFLHCYSNHLTSLDVSKNTSLMDLYCYTNKLTSLELGGCAKLAHLSCYSNQLTSLDVSKSPKLVQLSCRSNPSLAKIFLKQGQTISNFDYDEKVSTVVYI